MNWKEIGKSAALYVTAVLLSLSILVALFRLWRMDLRESFFYTEDGLLALVWTKTTIQTGWYLDNDRMAAPGAMDNRGFPISDSLHFAAIKAIALFDSDPSFVLNVYGLLLFPLSAVSCLFVLRQQGCARLTSLVAGQLFAFLPYPLMRLWLSGHIFLGACYLIPLASLVVLWVYMDEDLFFRQGPDGTRPKFRPLWARSLGALAISALMSCAGIYYAFFYCFFLVIGSASVSFNRKRLNPILTGALLIGVTMTGVLANLTPTLLRAAEQHSHVENLDRKPEQAEYFGLRIVQLVHPVAYNRSAFLSSIKGKYVTTAPFINENDSVSLGAIATIGFFVLLMRLLVRGNDTRSSALFGVLSRLTICAIMLGTMGGLGSVISYSGFPWIRGYNRIAIFIAFFSLFAFVLLYDRMTTALRATRWRWPAQAGLLAILAIGLYTQTGSFCTEACRKFRDTFHSDQEFAQRIEGVLPPHSMVFQLPCIAYPEARLTGDLCGYEMGKPYIHSQTLRWSYGAFDYQEAMAWQTTMRDKPVPQMVTDLALADFKGIYIDRRYFPDNAQWLEGEIERITHQQPLVSKNGGQSFFNLCPYQDALKDQYSPSLYERMRAAALKPCLVKWADGFSYAEGNMADSWHWGKPTSYLDLTNPADEPRQVTLRGRFVTETDGPAHVHIASDVFTDDVTANRKGTAWERQVVVPPGVHRLTFTSDAPCVRDHRPDLSFRLHNFSASEFAAPPDLRATQE